MVNSLKGQYKAHMKLKILFLLGLVLGGFSAAGGSAAEEILGHPVAVVELFTSQGCSSCPPADDLLAELDQRSDVLALAYHVDYWDYIGWKDTLGDPAYSDLQRAYAQSWGKNRIYTPQLIVNGAVDFVGSHRNAVEEGIAGAQLSVVVDLEYEEGVLDVAIEGVSGAHQSVVYLVTFRDRVEVNIERGENRGKLLSYAQVVTSRQIIGMWDPESGSHIKLPVSELFNDKSDGVAIIVQEQSNGLPGQILGAALFQM
jgi:hypothetical protein